MLHFLLIAVAKIAADVVVIPSRVPIFETVFRFAVFLSGFEKIDVFSAFQIFLRYKLFQLRIPTNIIFPLIRIEVDYIEPDM